MGKITVQGGKPIDAVVKSMASKCAWLRMTEDSGIDVVDKAGHVAGLTVSGAVDNLHSKEGWFYGTNVEGATCTNAIDGQGNAYLEELFAIQTLGSGLILISTEVDVVTSNLTGTTTTGMLNFGATQKEDTSATESQLAFNIHKIGTSYKCARIRIGSAWQYIGQPAANGTSLPAGKNSLVGIVDGLNKTIRLAVNGVEITPLDITSQIAGFDYAQAKIAGFHMLGIKQRQVSGISANMSNNFGLRNVLIARFDTHPGEAVIADYIAAHNTYHGQVPSVLTGM